MRILIGIKFTLLFIQCSFYKYLPDQYRAALNKTIIKYSLIHLTKAAPFIEMKLLTIS